MAQSGKQGFPRWISIGWIIVLLSSVAGLARLIADAIDKVASGQGAQTYRTFWLVEFSYVGLIVLVGVVIVALIVGTIDEVRERWQIRDLEKKYGTREDDRHGT